MNLLAQSTCCVNNAGAFGDGGTISDRALGVYTAVFWASVVLGVIVTALLLYAFVKFRRRSDADDPPQFTATRGSRSPGRWFHWRRSFRSSA